MTNVMNMSHTETRSESLGPIYPTPPGQDPSVLVNLEGKVRVISLNRPSCLNAIDIHLLRALHGEISRAVDDEQTNVIVLRGEGRAFCAGDDLIEQLNSGSLTDSQMKEFVDLLQDITKKLMLGCKLSIALVHGWAIGGGFSWTLNCDFGIWAESAIAYLPELRFGMFVSGGASYLLPKAIGRMNASEMAMTAPKISANALKDLGVAWRVVPESDLLETGLQLAHQLALLPTQAVQSFKRACISSDRESLLSALQFEAEACIAGAKDPDTVVRIKNFMESRQ